MSITSSFRSVSPDASRAYQSTTAINPMQKPTSAIEALRTRNCSGPQAEHEEHHGSVTGKD